MAERSVEEFPDTEFRMAQVVFPSQVNHFGTLFGGYALQWMDQAAWICATRYARKMMVTIASDRVEFKRPVPASAMVLLTARILRVGRTSVTVCVEMHAERPLTGEQFLATQGQFVMVAVDENGRATPVKS
jgi:acyl-CoA hydrolase